MILNRQKKRKVDTRRAARILTGILRHLQCKDREVCVVYLDDDGIREFNRAFRKKDRPTNVLSFSMREGDFNDLHPGMLGDILISVESAERDAAVAGIPFEDMLDYLAIHGVLHLLGYDHENAPEAAEEMQRKEEELFSLLHDYAIRAMPDR